MYVLMIYVNPLEISVEGMFFVFEVVKKCEKMESLDIYVGSRVVLFCVHA